ncbi:hypothetical protein BV898_07503 [Hypsibius exemplaris]|uniref:Uncharacterized protein n=1 Tax=Hypsibius exemplaris TaxID=2072580 RepID=A0A1W0WTI6_HYPEX|nr:hypothetical protein BV898_07503 [Hypsibius exemplaris]
MIPASGVQSGAAQRQKLRVVPGSNPVVYFNTTTTTEGDLLLLLSMDATPEPNVSVVLDSCGRVRGTRFSNNGYKSAVWLTRVSFPTFLLIGTIGNVIGIILVVNERQNGRRCGNQALDMSRKVFLRALFILDLCFL